MCILPAEPQSHKGFGGWVLIVIRCSTFLATNSGVGVFVQACLPENPAVHLLPQPDVCALGIWIQRSSGIPIIFSNTLIESP